VGLVLNVRLTKNQGSHALESLPLSCETELENLRWYHKQVPIGKVKAIRYREYSPEERNTIDEFEAKDTISFTLSKLDYGAFKYNHEFKLPKHLTTVPQSLLHEVENKTLGHGDNPVDRSDATAVSEYMNTLSKTNKSTWDRRYEHAKREFGLKCVEEVAPSRAHSVNLQMAQYLGASEEYRKWYQACKDWNLSITSNPRKNAFGWLSYVELPEDVTASVRANGEKGKHTTKKNSKKAMSATVARLEKTIQDQKTRIGELKKKRSNGDKGMEEGHRMWEQQLRDSETVRSELQDKMQGLQHALGTSSHRISILNTTLEENAAKLRESQTQNRLDKAAIDHLEQRVQELKGEVGWFKNQAFPPPTSTGAQVFASGSMSMRNTSISPGT